VTDEECVYLYDMVTSYIYLFSHNMLCYTCSCSSRIEANVFILTYYISTTNSDSVALKEV